MNKIKYQFRISHDNISKPIGIRFAECENKFNLLDFHILINQKPILKLQCHQYNNNNLTELYEYAINYIIDNKIGKYNYLEIDRYSHIINTYFDIIDVNILLQLL